MRNVLHPKHCGDTLKHKRSGRPLRPGLRFFPAGDPERDAIRELELGNATFGVASADQVIRARAKGAPVVVIAQLFQINPLQWIYRGVKPVHVEKALFPGGKPL